MRAGDEVCAARLLRPLTRLGFTPTPRRFPASARRLKTSIFLGLLCLTRWRLGNGEAELWLPSGPPAKIRRTGIGERWRWVRRARGPPRRWQGPMNLAAFWEGPPPRFRIGRAASNL